MTPGGHFYDVPLRLSPLSPPPALAQETWLAQSLPHGNEKAGERKCGSDSLLADNFVDLKGSNTSWLM